MAGILIVAHTPVASAMLGFAEHTYGVLPERVRAVDIPPHEDAKISFDRVVAAAKEVDTGKGILILTDVMGATPANVASRLVGLSTVSSLSVGSQVIVLTGMNLPMLMRAVSYRSDVLETLAQKALQGGINGILRLGTSINV